MEQFLSQPAAAGNSEDSRVNSPFRRGGRERSAGGPSRHPRPLANQRSRVLRVENTSPYVVLADLGWHCRSGCSRSPPEGPKGNEKRKRTKTGHHSPKQTRRAQAAGGRAVDAPGSTPRPTQTPRAAPHKPINITTHARGRDRQSRHAKLRSRRGGERRRDRNPRARTVQAAILTGGVAPAWCSPSGPSFQLGMWCEKERTHQHTRRHERRVPTQCMRSLSQATSILRSKVR